METQFTMATAITLPLALTCHPVTRPGSVQHVEARVGMVDNGVLRVSYSVGGNLAHLRVPPPRAPRRADCLWQHTCFEAFVAADGTPEYYELNFAPSGEWAAYAFRCYRQGAPLRDDGLAPAITVHSAADRLDLHTVIYLDRLLPAHPREPMRLGLSAVLEDENGMLSYWALQHPPGQPDFHHPDAFAVRLAPPVVDEKNDRD